MVIHTITAVICLKRKIYRSKPKIGPKANPLTIPPINFRILKGTRSNTSIISFSLTNQGGQYSKLVNNCTGLLCGE